MRPSMPVESGERGTDEEGKALGLWGLAPKWLIGMGALSSPVSSGQTSGIKGPDVPRVGSSVCTQETRTRNSLAYIVHKSKRLGIPQTLISEDNSGPFFHLMSQ